MANRFTSFCVLILVLSLSGLAGAQNIVLPMSVHVPADAVAYFGWAGADSQLQMYRTSDLGQFLDHSNLSQVAGEYLPKLWDQLAGESGDKQAVDGLQKSLRLLWHHPLAIYASNVKINADGTPDANVAMVCDAGTDAPELQADLEKLISGDPHLHVIAKDNLLVLGVDDSAKSIGGPTLAEQSAFLKTMGSLQKSPTIAIYIDGTAILKKADESADKNQTASEVWPKVRDALGIAGIKSFAMTAGFDGSNWMTASTLDAPSPRSGLLAVIEPKPIDPALLARVPESAGSVSVYNFDVAKLFDTIGEAMSARPESDKVFHQASGLATIGLGRNFRNQILGPLGRQWVMYSDAKLHSVVVLNHPNDADTASDSLVSATFGLVNLANTQIPGASTQPVVNAEQTTVKGIDLTSAVTKFASPSFAVKEGILYVGLSGDSVITSATQASVSPAKNLLHNPDFISAVQRLGIPGFASFDFCDLPRTAPQAYDNFGAAGKQLRQVMGLFNIEIPRIELPPIDQLKPHLSPALSISWADGDGVYSRSISPFPLSTYLLGDPQQAMVGMTTLSAATAALMPAFEQARENARAVQSQSNERQIVLAMMMYSVNHHGVFPPDLGTLASDGELSGMSLVMFVLPGGKTKVPAEIINGTKDQQATWINDHAEYVLLLPSQQLNQLQGAPQVAAIVPKDAEHATTRVPVGFADGHVETCKPERVQHLLHPDTPPDNP